jgi:hypothetical protein
VGLSVKRRYSRLTWLADSGDPFCFMDKTPLNNHRIYHRLNYTIEGKVFEEADVVSVTTEKTARLYSDIFPSDASKIKVIPPVLNLHLPELQKQERSLFANDKIILAYIGNLHKNIREPVTFLSLIKGAIRQKPTLKEEMEIHFFGQTDAFRADFGNWMEICRLHGPSPRNLVTRAMCEADILINIGNLTSYQLPSKLVEYVSFGKPIINIHSSEEDSSVEFLAGYPLVLNVKGDGSVVDSKVLVEFIESNKGRVVDKATVDRFISRHQPDKISDQYLKLIEGN